MSSTSTSRLSLFKAVPGSGEPFRTSDLNSNWDKVDAEAVAVDGRLDVLESAVGSSGTVQNAVNATNATNATSATTAGKATNVAGGAAGRLVVQSAADSTTFVASAGAAGKVLSSSLTSPFASWGDPVPFKLASGIATVSSSGSLAITYGSAFAAGVTPVVSLTPVSSNLNVATVASVSASSNTGFTIYLRAQSSAGSNFAAAAGTVHWTAVQYLSSGDGTGN